jgi:hypothetical protein
MKEIWIIGSGRFGSLAYQRLSKTLKDTHFVLIDSVKENFPGSNDRGLAFEQADGIEFLKENLSTSNCPDWIIPAVPLHVAAEWILARLGAGRIRRLKLPNEIDQLLPNPVRGTDGSIYVSHADFLCPDNCAEPRDICTMTRKKRKRNMFEVLENLQLPSYGSLVIRSHQLGPGIGGYRPEQLFSLMDKAKKTTDNLLASTACRCHGVMSGLKRL